MKVVVITGSREWRGDRDVMRAALSGCELLIVGDARGADSAAFTIARDELGLSHQHGIDVHHAQWLRDGKKAGSLRNGRMVLAAVALWDAGHIVIAHAFPLADSRGTWDCVRKLRATRWREFMIDPKHAEHIVMLEWMRRPNIAAMAASNPRDDSETADMHKGAARSLAALDYALTILRSLGPGVDVIASDELQLLRAKAGCWDTLWIAESAICQCEIGPIFEHEHGCKSEVAYEVHQEALAALNSLESKERA